MRNPNFACALTRAQNSGPPLHKILNPPLVFVYEALSIQTHRHSLPSHYPPTSVSPLPLSSHFCLPSPTLFPPPSHIPAGWWFSSTLFHHVPPRKVLQCIYFQTTYTNACPHITDLSIVMYTCKHVISWTQSIINGISRE